MPRSGRWQARKVDATITKEPTTGFVCQARKPGRYGQDQLVCSTGTLTAAKQAVTEWYGQPIEWLTA